MGKLKQLYVIPKSRMKAVIITLAIVVLVSVLFVINENKNNREAYLDVYRKQQQDYTEQLGNQVEILANENSSPADFIEYFSEKAKVSGSSWMFVCEDDTVVFAKDKTTTNNLRKSAEKETFLLELQEQNYIFTSEEKNVQGRVYLIGTVTDEYYALTSGKVLQHEIYVYLVLGILIMLGVLTVIAMTASLNREQETNQKLEDVLQKQNQKLERTEEKLIAQPEGELAATSENDYYDSELIQLFLQKSECKELRPLQILFLQIEMEERYYSRQEIFDAVDEIKNFLWSTHVIGEIGKGRFVVLMYRTTQEEAAAMMEKIQVLWGRQMRFHMKLAEVGEGETALAVYEKHLKEGERHGEIQAIQI